MTPKRVADISEPIEQIYSDMTDELLLNIARHLNSSTWTWTALGEIETLETMGQLTEENVKIINGYVKKIPQAVKDAMNDSRLEALSEIEDKLESAALNGYLTPPITDGTAAVAEAFAAQATSQLNLVNQTMLDSSLAAYQTGMYDLRQGMQTIESDLEKAEAQATIDLAAGQTAIGAETRTGALRKALMRLNANGITGFYDRTGRSWSAEAYVNMDIRTTVHNTYIQSVRTRQEDYGSDVFQVSSHAGARPLCYPYQGKLYSWGDSGGRITLGDGQTYKYESIKVTSYGEPAGLFGINCGHVPYPMIPRVSEKVEEEIQPKEENDREYQESQQQRSLERAIRYQKRELEMLGNNATQADKEKLKQAQANMRAFIEQTGRTRSYDREQIVTQRQSSKAPVSRPDKPNQYVQKTLYALKRNKNIAYNSVKDSTIIKTERQMVRDIAGGDKTDGSCASAALAYIGQKNGWEVRDFRGGDSQKFFSKDYNLRNILRYNGVNMETATAKSSVESGRKLLGKVQEGKEYFFAAGQHAAIVKKMGDKFYYMELQDPLFNGWKRIKTRNDDTLKRRFGCDDVDTYAATGFYELSYMADIATLRNSDALKETLGYLNTDKGDEQKGATGRKK